MTISLRPLLWGIVMTFCLNVVALQLNALYSDDSEEAIIHEVKLEDLITSERMLPQVVFLPRPNALESTVDYLTQILALLNEFPAIENYRRGRLVTTFWTDSLLARYDAMLKQLLSDRFHLEGTPQFRSQFSLFADRLAEIIDQHITIINDEDPALVAIAECLEAIYSLLVFQIQFEQEVLPQINQIENGEGDHAKIKELIITFYGDLFEWILKLTDLKAIESFLRGALPQIRNFHLVFLSPETLTVQRVQELYFLFHLQWINLHQFNNQHLTDEVNRAHGVPLDLNGQLNTEIIVTEMGSNFM
tara:strand:- start:165 stop:1076 length:912 start_codon:yes stop_codon:yes gene_type:complete